MAADPLQLPIRQHTNAVLDVVRRGRLSIVIGETGSGKTTQLPQMLLDAGLAGRGTIAVTQPRRVAAISVARRVAVERGARVGDEVGYVVRFDECSSSRTRIKYVTDGTLLRELLDDPELSKYSVVVLDEAHERSLNTDILFALLKQIAARRGDGFKVVVMSATLDAQQLSRYFNDCPVLTVPGRQFEVQVMHSKENHTKDYLSAAVTAAVDIHVHQPPGDILVFLAGQAEIDKAVKQIEDQVSKLSEEECPMDLMVLPLYAALPMEMQTRVFAAPLPNCRRCIVATNIAETSITVDGVVYVIDPGMVKEKQFDPNSGMERLAVQPISQTQATQRKGRAGRTRPGKCYRLYTQAYYDAMPFTTAPEIQRTSLLGTVLHLKSLPMDVDVLSFDFVDPPSRVALEEALRQLYILDALDLEGRVTDMGKLMVQVPLEPSLSRALVAAVQLGCLPEMLAVTSLLSVENLFTAEAPSHLQDPQQAALAEDCKRAHQELQRDGFGDHIFLLRLWERLRFAPRDPETLKRLRINRRGFAFAEKVYTQLSNIVDTKILPALNPSNGSQGREESRARDREHRDDRSGHPSSSREASRGDASRDERGPSHKRRRTTSPEDRRNDVPGGRRGLHGDESKRSARYGNGDGRGGGGDSRNGGSRDHASDVRQDGERHKRQRELDGRRREGGGARGMPAAARAKDPITALRRALSIGFANRVANRMRLHNGYHTLNTKASAASIHPTAAKMTLQDGLLPSWIVYHEFVETSKPFLRNVCAIEAEWVAPTLKKVQECDAQALSKASSGRPNPSVTPAQLAEGQLDASAAAGTRRADDTAIAAARARFLVRRQNKASAAIGKSRR